MGTKLHTKLNLKCLKNETDKVHVFVVFRTQTYSTAVSSGCMKSKSVQVKSKSITKKQSQSPSRLADFRFIFQPLFAHIHKANNYIWNWSYLKARQCQSVSLKFTTWILDV